MKKTSSGAGRGLLEGRRLRDGARPPRGRTASRAAAHLALRVTSTSEILLPELREAITEGFGVPVVDTFGSTEGLVGTTAPGDDVFVFNSDVCIVEAVDHGGRPVPPGVPSDKVLVTNLSNRVRPLLRYEMNDCFDVLAPTGRAPGDGRLRARVSGRSDAALRFGALAVHPFVVRTVLAAASGVVDYQVRQRPNGIDVDVVADAGGGRLDLGGLRAGLQRALAAAGLDRPEVVGRRVDELDRHPESGK